MRHVVGIEAVKCRLIQAVQSRVEVCHEVLLGQDQFLMLGTDGFGDLSRNAPFDVL
jgi:hypothetical protein